MVAVTPAVLVVVDVLAWALFHSATGIAVHLAPRRWFTHDTWLTRPRQWERGGRGVTASRCPRSAAVTWSRSACIPVAGGP